MTSYRVPTGEIDSEVRARRIADGGPERLDVRTFRRSPAEVSADAFLPTAAGVTVQVQYADALIEAIAKAAGLVVTITEPLVEDGTGEALTEGGEPLTETRTVGHGLGVNLGRGFGPGYGQSYGTSAGHS